MPIVEQQTEALINPDRRLFNLPSTFRIPTYIPYDGGGSGGASYRTTNHYAITVNVEGGAGNGRDFVAAVEAAVARALHEGQRNGRTVPNGLGLANGYAVAPRGSGGLI